MTRMVIILMALTVLSFSNTENGDTILGKWYTENNKGTVEIFKKGDLYYSKLIELKEPNDNNGKPRKDNKNSNPNLKTRNLIGILIFWNMEYSSKNKRWENGIFYDPDMGHEAKGFITMIDDNTIKVKGYVGFEWISKSQIWVRKK